MAQSTITNFFINRKRPAAEDLQTRNKVMILESDVSSAASTTKLLFSEAREVSACVKLDIVKAKPMAPAPVITPAKGRSALKTPVRSTKKVSKPRDANQPDMKAFLKNIPKTEGQEEVAEQPKEEASSAVPEQPNVIFEVKGLLSPRKKRAEAAAPSPVKQEPVQEEEPEKAPEKTLQKDAASEESIVVKARKELSLGDIKSRLSRSARLNELRASLARLERGREKLAEIDRAKQQVQQSPRKAADKPQLDQFQSIELEVPISPSKSPMTSPRKMLSPRKLLGPPSPMKPPAYQRYASLTVPGTPALALPYSYRHLAELFRCVDTVVSLLHNRKEVVTFPKLQPAVQEMSRKTFTERHLAQIVTVLPEAYKMQHEKVRSFGMTSKQEKYELALVPILKPDEENGDRTTGPSMTPTILLRRRREFYNNLLETAKMHHESFLQTLDPPIVLSKEKVTRWHPEFLVDQVPDIVPSDLPKPPNQDKCYSAKDVLAKSRELYSCNARMERALESVAKSQVQSGHSVEVRVVDAQPVVNNPPTSPFKNMQLGSALKGIPKALLEKVRARQAAKAVEAMTRSAAQDKEAVQYSRLPELARILRTTFVAEKKGALPLEIVLEKVGNSFRSALSHRELEEHLRLLARAVPGWISFDHLLKTDYVKLSKGGDMNRVMKKLESLAQEKCGGFKL